MTFHAGLLTEREKELCAEIARLTAEIARKDEALHWVACHHLREANGAKDQYLDPLSGADCVRKARAALAPMEKTNG